MTDTTRPDLDRKLVDFCAMLASRILGRQVSRREAIEYAIREFNDRHQGESR